MNKPIALMCACTAGIGLLVLSRSTYLAIAYGHGDMAAGNFNRCWYSSSRDPQTGQLLREWNEVGESTEDSIVARLDMWFVGVAFVVVGAVTYVVQRSSQWPRFQS